jgi:hypothetical protein
LKSLGGQSVGVGINQQVFGSGFFLHDLFFWGGQELQSHFGAANPKTGASKFSIPYLDAHQVGGRGHGLC